MNKAILLSSFDAEFLVQTNCFNILFLVTIIDDFYGSGSVKTIRGFQPNPEYTNHESAGTVAMGTIMMMMIFMMMILVMIKMRIMVMMMM